MTTQLSLLTPVSEQLPSCKNIYLVDYGIQNEQSDYRAHVGYKTQHVFVFPTKLIQQFLTSKQNQYQQKSAYQFDKRTGNRIETAKGFLVPLSHIPELQSILIPPDVHKQFPIYRDGDQSPTTKGLYAVQIVVAMLKKHLIALPLDIQQIDDMTLQIEGTDIIVQMKLRLQVKCDYCAGEKRYGGTGNLYLQIAECNPFQYH
jgi:hypothetical protein